MKKSFNSTSLRKLASIKRTYNSMLELYFDRIKSGDFALTNKVSFDTETLLGRRLDAIVHMALDGQITQEEYRAIQGKASGNLPNLDDPVLLLAYALAVMLRDTRQSVRSITRTFSQDKVQRMSLAKLRVQQARIRHLKDILGKDPGID